MSSLRRGLTLWLWTALAVVGAVCLSVAILGARRETQRQLDYQMQQVAVMLASQPFNPRVVVASDQLERPMSPWIYVQHDHDDDLIVTVRNSAGQMLYASATNRQLAGGMLPDLQSEGFQTVRIGADSYRVFAAVAGERHIQVAQSMEAIQESAEQVAVALLVPIGLLLPILALVIGWVIRRQLQPLNIAAAEIAARPPLSMELVPDERMPAEVRPLVQEINRLLRRLTTAVEREQQFVMDAAHALRTPMTALQLQAEVLEGGSTPEDRSARLEDLRGGIRRIIRLSEQLLTLARSQSESVPVNVSTDLDSALKEVLALYQSAADSKQVRMTLEVGEAARVYGNPRRLTLIFGNLLDNAVRFTPSGGLVEIRAQVTNGSALVQVQDEGSGLPAAELSRVFGRFYQAPGSDSSGSGLGLATVDGLVRQLGGEVRLESRADRSGLIASVTLQLAATTG